MSAVRMQLAENMDDVIYTKQNLLIVVVNIGTHHFFIVSLLQQGFPLFSELENKVCHYFQSCRTVYVGIGPTIFFFCYVSACFAKLISIFEFLVVAYVIYFYTNFCGSILLFCWHDL